MWVVAEPPAAFDLETFNGLLRGILMPDPNRETPRGFVAADAETKAAAKLNQSKLVVVDPTKDGLNTPPRSRTPPADRPDRSIAENADDLRESWLAVWSKESSTYYYWNVVTNEATWVKPVKHADTPKASKSEREEATEKSLDWNAAIEQQYCKFREETGSIVGDAENEAGGNNAIKDLFFDAAIAARAGGEAGAAQAGSEETDERTVEFVLEPMDAKSESVVYEMHLNGPALPPSIDPDSYISDSDDDTSYPADAGTLLQAGNAADGGANTHKKAKLPLRFVHPNGKCCHPGCGSCKSQRPNLVATGLCTYHAQQSTGRCMEGVCAHPAVRRGLCLAHLEKAKDQRLEKVSLTTLSPPSPPAPLPRICSRTLIDSFDLLRRGAGDRSNHSSVTSRCGR